jgi:hypothetical protein
MEIQNRLSSQTADAERLRLELAPLASDARRLETELAQARDRIVHMERSAFWRARLFWNRLRGGG